MEEQKDRHLPWGEAAAVYSAGLLSGVMLTVLGVVASRVLLGTLAVSL